MNIGLQYGIGSDLEKTAFFSVGGGGVQLGHKDIPIQGRVGYSNLLGVIPLPSASARLGSTDGPGLSLGATFPGVPTVGVDSGSSQKGTGKYRSPGLIGIRKRIKEREAAMEKEAIFGGRKKRWEAIAGTAPTHRENLSVNSPSRQAFEHMHRPQSSTGMRPKPGAMSRLKSFRPTGKQLAVGGGIAAVGLGAAALLRARHKAKKEYEAPLRGRPQQARPQQAQPMQPMRPMQPKMAAFEEVVEILDFEKKAAILAVGEEAAQEILRDLRCSS